MTELWGFVSVGLFGFLMGMLVSRRGDGPHEHERLRFLRRYVRDWHYEPVPLGILPGSEPRPTLEDEARRVVGEGQALWDAIETTRKR